jgi:hypothetical protein
MASGNFPIGVLVGPDNRGEQPEYTLLSNPPTGSGDSLLARRSLTSRNYGVYATRWLSPLHHRGRRADQLQFDASDLTYYVIYGATPPNILNHYNASRAVH